MSYLSGYREAFDVVQSLSKIPLDQRNCAAEAKVTNEQIADVFKAWLILKPQFAALPIAITMRNFMIETWPCTK